MATTVSAQAAAILLALVTCAGAFWQADLTARSSIPIDERSVLQFSGNLTHADHFKVLELEGNHMLLGARDIVYNLSLDSLREHREQRIEWRSEEHDVDMCLLKGRKENACHNYIRVLAKRPGDELFVCGTNSYKPKCRSYRKKPEVGYVPEGGDRNGVGLCPYDPNHNSTVTFVGDQIYSGTVADFASSDPLIFRDRSLMRTEQYELKQLNAPSFVGSMEHGEHVYFFLRETAVEYINCGKRAYSRVARVCKNDRGGSYKYAKKWTSFLKSRLNCSIPGDYPFYFDEIQSVSAVQSGVYGGRTEEILYAVFTTPVNSIPGSAVCAFRMSEIIAAFDGAFKHQQDMNSNWLPLKNSDVPSPRPGVCVNDSRRLLDAHVNFIQAHPLMDAAVPSLHGRPVLVHTSLQQRFTSIAVDEQVRAADGTPYDVLFVGTDNGRVLKAINAASSADPLATEPVLVEDLAVFPSGAAVVSLKVVRRPSAPPKLVAVSGHQVRSIPLHRCGDKAVRCGACVRLQDPYCGWEAAGQRCAPIDSPSWPEGIAIVQNVSHGVHPHCPYSGHEPKILYQEATIARATGAVAVPADHPTPCDCSRTDSQAAVDSPDAADSQATTSNDRRLYNVPNGGQRVLDIVERTKAYQAAQAALDKDSEYMLGGGKVYSAETLAAAVAVTCLLAVLVGFVAGWWFSRRWRQRSAGTTHLDRQSRLKHIDGKPDNRCDQSFLNSEQAFMGNNGKQINLVVNQTKNSNDKNANSAADNKPLQKVRKMYL